MITSKVYSNSCHFHKQGTSCTLFAMLKSSQAKYNVYHVDI